MLKARLHRQKIARLDILLRCSIVGSAVQQGRIPMSSFYEVIRKNESSILASWLAEMVSSTRRSDLMGDVELRQQAAELLRLITNAAEANADPKSDAFSNTREYLREIAKSRMEQGFSPSETALFVLSLKQPVFNALRDALNSNSSQLVIEILTVGNMLDWLAVETVNNAIEFRDLVITRQQEEMLELSTPVVKLWEGVLALPLIGTLDSARTQVVMESLLSAIVETNSQIAIIDITGVPTVDTLVAQHLIKTITAARLMGADCYLSGIRPAIAQTIVHLGIDLVDVQTKAKLADAFALALTRLGKTVVNAKPIAKTTSKREEA